LKIWPIPKPQEGQFLVKVDASTVNPSDRGRLTGRYAPTPLPNVMGLEGTGKVIEVNGAGL
jgi:NADPH:quinone reductase-like Zn-dependent oxidoreductase